jgi:two-component system, OmpR family, KDP operon response regulator KdpE
MNDATAIKHTVLIIEDDHQIRRFLRATLSSQGYRLHEAVNGAEGLSLAASQQPDLIILDLGLPDVDGLTVARRIREWSSTPILVLSARGQEADKIAALDAGADDYVTKPFGVGELTARMRVALRHAARAEHGDEDPVYEVGNLRVDLARREVSLRGEEVHLTPTEFNLLAVLVHHAGKVVTHRQLLRDVWGESFHEQAHYIRVYMQQLRKKLEETPARPRYLRTEPGVGYRLVDE